MWFKNIRAYRLTSPFTLTPEQLAEQLAQRLQQADPAKHDGMLPGNIARPPGLYTDFRIGPFPYSPLSLIHAYFFQIPVH